MPTQPVRTDLDMLSTSKITNLPNGTANGDAVNVSQLNSAVEGLAWKDSVRVASVGNINLSSPGATIDGITMATGDRFLAKDQTTGSQNGIYIWNGAAVAATRSLDMDTAAEVEQAVTTVEEGTAAGSSYRQTAVNVTLGTTTLTWASFGTGAPAASETTAGIAEFATQAEVDTGTDTTRTVRPSTLAGSVYAKKKFVQSFGDGAATSYAITHNLNTEDVQVTVYETSGTKRDVMVEVQRTSVNQITVLCSPAPSSNALRAVIIA